MSVLNAVKSKLLARVVPVVNKQVSPSIPEEIILTAVWSNHIVDWD
jgi:hypothetical protein